MELITESDNRFLYVGNFVLYEDRVISHSGTPTFSNAHITDENHVHFIGFIQRNAPGSICCYCNGCITWTHHSFYDLYGCMSVMVC